jgi:hypothetical protein
MILFMQSRGVGILFMSLLMVCFSSAGSGLVNGSGGSPLIATPSEGTHRYLPESSLQDFRTHDEILPRFSVFTRIPFQAAMSGNGWISPGIT